jgi:hypothetical protein
MSGKLSWIFDMFVTNVMLFFWGFDKGQASTFGIWEIFFILKIYNFLFLTLFQVPFIFGQGEGLWCLTSFSTIFSYIVVVSFIGGGNRRKPLTFNKSLTNLLT